MTDIEAANREVCEKLGIPWSEREGHYGHFEKNPDLTTDTGKVQLLRLMVNSMKWPDWNGFVSYLTGKESVIGSFLIIDYILDDTGKLLFAVRDWLRREKEEKGGLKF